MEKEEYLGDYRARSSLHTFFSPGLSLEELPDLSLINSNWQKKMVEHDLLRTPLELTDSNFIIIDFIDDRFQKVLYKQKLASFSNELIQILTEGTYDVAFKQGSVKDLEHWRKSCLEFSRFMAGNEIKIVLHKSRFAKKHFDGHNMVENENQPFIKQMNDLLEIYEEIFLETFPEALTLDVKEELIISDPNHKWGLAPFHYVPEYYDEAWSQIENLIDN